MAESFLARLPVLRRRRTMHGLCRILPPLSAARFPTTLSRKNWAAVEWAWSTKPKTRASAEMLP